MARFNDAASERNITVDARLIRRALGDYRHLPDLEREALNCAEWLAANAPRNGTKPRVAHLTLRSWLERRAKDRPERKEHREPRYTRPANA